jgi:amidase
MTEANLADRSIAELQAELASGSLSSEALVEFYLHRIATIDRAGDRGNAPALHSVIATNPDALAHARQLDAERRERGARGPLHGIPLLIKDNIETSDATATTAGSLALAHNLTRRDSPCVARLRAAGAIMLGKANLSEWANIRSDRSVSGWSALGGLTRNPHVLDRSACGSSSGSAASAAAGLAAASIGTETDGSVVCPAEVCGIVGIKPTVGLISRTHVIPISHSQDTPGPMARSVADAALLLSVMAGRDPADSATARADVHRTDYAAALSTDSLAGARLGVWRPRRARTEAAAIFSGALDALSARGANAVELPGFRVPRKLSALELTVMLTELKSGLDAYLASTPASVTARTLAEIVGFNRSEPRELALFGQELFEAAVRTNGISDPAYRRARAASRRMARRTLDRVFLEHSLDAIVTITGGPAWRIDIVRGDDNSGESTSLPAVAGYPHLTVPMGLVKKLPVGLSLIGPAWSEGRLLSLGYAFEQATRARVFPSFLPSLELDDVSARAFDPGQA